MQIYNMGKANYEHKTVRRNRETGEVIEEVRNSFIKFDNEPSYVKMYSKGLSDLARLGGTELRVLMLLLGRVGYASNGAMQIITTDKVRSEVCEQLGLHRKSFFRATRKLVVAGVFERMDKGVYGLNPFLFGKGEWPAICKLRREYQGEYDFTQGK